MKKLSELSIVKVKDNLTWREINKEAILLNLENGDYFEVNDLGLEIWKRLNGKSTIKNIVEAIAAKYEEKPAKVSSDTIEFIESLNKLKIIEVL